MKKLILIMMLLSQISFAQTITANTNAMELAQLILTNDNNYITITNATLNCPATSSGIMVVPSTNLPFDSAVILTTGFTNSTIGNASSTSSSATCNTCSDNDLYLLGQQIGNPGANDYFDACELSIDIMSSGDSLYLSYIFASEEYLEWICASGDQFAILISGPGISGSYSNSSKLISTLPDTSLPVGINTVNDGSTSCISNSQYFVNYWSLPNTVVMYDGMTVLLQAYAKVQPFQTYNLRFKIGDSLDQVNDSAIMIKAGSLNSNTMVGIDEKNMKNELAIYPNPAADKISVGINGLISGENQLNIFDINGRQIYTQPVSIHNGNNLLSIDVSGFDQGVYLIRVADAIKTFVKN